MDFSHIVNFPHANAIAKRLGCEDLIRQRLSLLPIDHTSEVFDQDTKLRHLHQQGTQQMVYVVAYISAMATPERFLKTNWHRMPWGDITMEEFNQIAGDIPITLVSMVPNCEEVYLKACAKCDLVSNVKNFITIDKFIIRFLIEFGGEYLRPDNPDTDCKYLFNITNGKIKMPRLLLMEELWNRKLLDKALWSWNVNDESTWTSTLGSNFNFPYQTPKPIDQLHITKKEGNQWDREHAIFPITGYKDCYIEVCAEALEEEWSTTVTEKTIRPYLALKPSLQLNNFGHYNYLQSLGIELYDELFDYSIIEKPKLKDRIKGIADNLSNLAQLSKSEMDNKILKLKDKMIHNRQVFLDLPIEPMPTPEIEYLASHNIIPHGQQTPYRVNNIGNKWYSR